MNGLAFLHLELTSRCNKGDGTPGSGCWMCGRRKMEREHPDLCHWGDMPLEMVYEISKQVPQGIVVQLHNNGESTLYPHLGDALNLFRHCIRCFNTNGKLLLEKADEIIGNLETLTVSVVQNDEEGEEQYETVCKFLEKKGDQKPAMVYRLLGKVRNPERWEKAQGVCARRILHAPGGSFDYEKRVTIPEIGICLDLLTHLCVDRYGNISLCVRFDPEGELRLGNIRDMTLEDAWNGPKRKTYLDFHVLGKRDCLLGCSRCEYWGVPRGD